MIFAELGVTFRLHMTERGIEETSQICLLDFDQDVLQSMVDDDELRDLLSNYNDGFIESEIKALSEFRKYGYLDEPAEEDEPFDQAARSLWTLEVPAALADAINDFVEKISKEPEVDTPENSYKIN